MESTPLISSTMDILILPFALTFFIIWIVRRRKKRNKNIKVNGLVKKPYATSQIFGIIGILVFMLPISWIVVVMLQKGIYILFILLFGWIKLQIIATIMKTIFFVSTTFLMFTGVYLVCEFIWPNRYLAEIKSIDKESINSKIDEAKTV